MNIPIENIALINFAAGTNLIPLVMAALLLDAGIIVIWYYLGVILNNRGYRASALGEFYQLAATVIIAAVIIGSLGIFSSTFSSILGSTHLLNSATVNSMCANVMAENANYQSGLSLIGPTDSLLAGSGNSMAFPGVCTLLNPKAGDVGAAIDYPLAADAVVIANVTSQSAANLNSLYYIENFILFLDEMKIRTIVCVGELDSCELPDPLNPEIVSIMFQYQPYDGLSMLKGVGSTIGSLTTTEVEGNIAQLIVMAIILSAWPYLLFIGLVLRSTFFTRKLGGAMIAVAVGAILFTPIIFSVEYLTLSNANAFVGAPAAYGFGNTITGNSVTDLPAASCITSGLAAGVASRLAGNLGTAAAGYIQGTGSSCTAKYNLNFFVEPNFQAIAQFNSCWAGSGATYFANEASDAVVLAIPGVGLLSGALSLLGSIGGTLTTGSAFNFQPLLPYTCSEFSAYNTFIQLLEATAIGGIVGYFLPILNVIIVFTGIVGLSRVLGGDTSFAGLSKLV
jgi:hypothetical protein